MNVLSFHLCLETDNNRCCSAVKGPTAADIAAMCQADAVILPQGCLEDFYKIARQNCPAVFPNYDLRYDYNGKNGQARLFKLLGLLHPRTAVFSSLADFCHHWSVERLPMDLPFVFKLSWGGEGNNVFLIQQHQDLTQALNLTSHWERHGRSGFICQEYLPCGGRSLRVVVIDQQFYSYWRCPAANGNSFYSNLAKGASIDRHSDPHLQQAAVVVLRDFCQTSGINLAGFDFLFVPGDERPYFLEINYCFRTKGLGGTDAYLALLTAGVRQWISRLPLP